VTPVDRKGRMEEGEISDIERNKKAVTEKKQVKEGLILNRWLVQKNK
jgi:hypothetical protein